MPGVLALLLSSGIYLFSHLLDSWIDHIKHKPRTVQALVKLGADDYITEIKPILRKYQTEFEKAFPTVDASESQDLAQYYLLYVDSLHVKALEKELENYTENVDAVMSNAPLTWENPSAGQVSVINTKFLADDPMLSNQWYAEYLGYNAVFDLLKNKKPVKKAKVAIIDTGVDAKHEDLSAVYEGKRNAKDAHGHGTHCAGLAAGITNNAKGIASLNWEGKFLSLEGYSALNENGQGTPESIAQGIIDAVKDKADVLSLSLGGFSPLPSKVQKDAIAFALKNKTIVVVAAGNSNMDARLFSPANIEGVISVAAVNDEGKKAPFSNTNASLKMPLSAPGTDIYSSMPDNKYQSMNGTSMATPIVSGLIGMMRSFDPTLSADQAYKILHESGKEATDNQAQIGKIVQPEQALRQLVK